MALVQADRVDLASYLAAGTPEVEAVFCDEVYRADGAAGGIRTHDIQNHNLALLPTELQPP